MAFTKIAEEVIEIRVDGDADVVRAYGKILASQEELDKSSDRSRQSTEQAAGAFSKLERRLITAGGAAQVFETGMRAAAAALRLVSAPVNLATSFEREFNLVRTLSSEVTNETRQDLLDLAARTPQTASQIATAAYNSLSRGIREADLVGFLETAANAATAGNTDITTASESLLKSLSAFKDQGESVATVADKVFTTVKIAATNFTELNASLGQGLAVSAYGVRLEELLAIAGTLTKTLGVSFSEAIVRTNALISVVTGSTEKNKKALTNLGVEFGVAAIKSKGLSAVLDDIRQKSQGSAEALNLLSGNKRAREGLLGTLSGSNFEELTFQLDAITNSTGGFSEALGKVQGDSLSTQKAFESLKESVLRELGEAVLPQLNRVLADLGAFLRQNRSEIVGTFKEVADAVVALGTFIVSNGDRIAMMIGAMFSAKVVGGFVSAVTAASSAVTAFGTTSGAGFVSKLALGMRAIPGLGLIAGAAAVLYDVFNDNFTEPVKQNMRELQKSIDEALNRAAQARGFAGGSDQESRLRADALRGSRLGFGGTSGGEFDTPVEFLRRYREQVRSLTGEEGERADAQIALAEAVKADKRTREAQIDVIKQKVIALNQERIAQQAVKGVRDASVVAITKEIEAERKRIETIEKGADRLKRGALLAIQRDRPSPAATGAPAVSGATRQDKAAENRAKRTAAMNDAFRRREIDAQIAAIEDQDRRQMAALEERQNREIAAAEKQGADLNLLFTAQDAERQNLETQIRARNEEKDRQQSERKREVEREFTIRSLEARGLEADAEFLRRSDQDAAEIERMRESGLVTLDLERRLAEERLRIHERMTAQKKVLEAQAIAGAASAMGTLFGNVRDLGKAIGASESLIGKLESLMLLSKVAFHTAAGFGEIANAASATAMGLAPKAFAHKVAASSHFVAAATSGVQAVKAMAGGGGGGGGSASISAPPATAPAGPRFGQQQTALEARDTQPTIQFGDIILSSIPSLLSREGAAELGRTIAGDVARELRDRSNIAGTARLPQRAIGRS